MNPSPTPHIIKYVDLDVHAQTVAIAQKCGDVLSYGTVPAHSHSMDRLHKKLSEGIVVGAHKLARIIWALIVSGQPYDQAKAFAITPATTARRLKNLQNQAKALNMTLVPA